MFEEILNPLFFTEKGRYLSLAALTVAGLLLLSSVLDTFSTWHSDFVLAHAKPVMATNLSDETGALIASIPQAHLFGESASGDLLPITSLQLHLTGIVKMTQALLSRAIISEAGKSGKLYAVGDTLLAGIKIYAINDDNIVLERGGHLEKLPLTRAHLLFQDRPKSLWSNPM